MFPFHAAEIQHELAQLSEKSSLPNHSLKTLLYCLHSPERNLTLLRLPVRKTKVRQQRAQAGCQGIQGAPSATRDLGMG